MPVGATEDRVVGSLDLRRALGDGEAPRAFVEERKPRTGAEMRDLDAADTRGRD